MRLKTVTGTYTNALQDLAKIQAIKFTWKHDQSNTPQVGVSAQSVELAVPEAISTSRNISTPDDETDYLSVRYTELIPLMIASIQELKAELDFVKVELAALKNG
jgi:Tfp pilus assembly PilM family ATPase